MKHEYIPRSVCPMKIEFDLEGDVVTDIKFQGGCNGNLKAMGLLLDGMTVEEISKQLKGLRCGAKKTSCADQLVTALEKALEDSAN